MTKQEWAGIKLLLWSIFIIIGTIACYAHSA